MADYELPFPDKPGAEAGDTVGPVDDVYAQHLREIRDGLERARAAGLATMSNTLRQPDFYIEFSVHPRGIGYGGPGPKPDFDPRSLTSDEISRIGHSLYHLLRGFSGYRAAIVGWDPEPLVDVEDLEADWRNGDLPGYNGLVLADDLCQKWRLGPEWSTFEPGYRWLPYTGSRIPGSPR